jgi:2-haloacid dehalogenase
MALISRQTNSRPIFVFDFGGVLINWDPRFLYRKLFDGDEQAMENFLAEIDFPAWNLLQDAGRPFAEAVADLCDQFPQRCDLIHAYNERYMESLTEPIQGSVDILKRLRDSGARLQGLSNWSVEKFALVRAKYDFFGWFEDILLSGEAKVNKPDERIFHLLLERVGRKAEECLLIDDSAANIAAAQKLGFRTHHFKSPNELEQELARAGLLTYRPGI